MLAHGVVCLILPDECPIRATRQPDRQDRPNDPVFVGCTQWETDSGHSEAILALERRGVTTKLGGCIINGSLGVSLVNAATYSSRGLTLLSTNRSFSIIRDPWLLTGCKRYSGLDEYTTMMVCNACLIDNSILRQG